MDFACTEQMDMQSLTDRQREIENEWNNLLSLKREVEAKAKYLDQMEKQFDIKWNMLISETQKLADDKKAFERKRDFYSRVSAHEEVRRTSNIVQPEMFFSGVSSEKALKKRYKDLIKIYHPDSEGGDNETVQEINREYDNLKQAMNV